MSEATIPTPKPSRALLVTRVGILAGLVAGVWYVGDHLDWVRGESIPVTLAWITGGPVQLGDYVYFEAQSEVINNGEKALLTKQVACVEGMTVSFNGTAFACDGKPLGGEVIRKTSDGREVKVSDFQGVIPEGKVFVIGTHPRSFDSRYLGLLDRKDIKRVEPIL
jgi:type IV secretory pathway protease TraF